MDWSALASLTRTERGKARCKSKFVKSRAHPKQFLLDCFVASLLAISIRSYNLPARTLNIRCSGIVHTGSKFYNPNLPDDKIRRRYNDADIIWKAANCEVCQLNRQVSAYERWRTEHGLCSGFFESGKLMLRIAPPTNLDHRGDPQWLFESHPPKLIASLMLKADGGAPILYRGSHICLYLFCMIISYIIIQQLVKY